MRFYTTMSVGLLALLAFTIWVFMPWFMASNWSVPARVFALVLFAFLASGLLCWVSFYALEKDIRKK